MEIKVNETKVQIFAGARVKDVIRKYSTEMYQDVLKGKKIVRNDNQPVSLNGELTGQENLKISEN